MRAGGNPGRPRFCALGALDSRLHGNDGNTQAARWCAGCHDPVPFFSGEFDDPNYDDVNTKSSQAGITCTVCHSISNVNSTRGNADYTIEEPQHYPFATSKNPLLLWLNITLVKAKPERHEELNRFPAVSGKTWNNPAISDGLLLVRNETEMACFRLSPD